MPAERQTGLMRRSLRLLISCVLRRLALGATCTFLVATAAAWRATDFAQTSFPTRSGERLTGPTGAKVQESGGRAPPNTQYLEIRAYERFGATFGVSRLRPFGNYTPAGTPPPARTPPESVARRWERSELLPCLDGRREWPDPTKGDSIWLKASGWPFRCLVCTIHIKNAPNFTSHTWTVQGGLVLSNATSPGWADWPPSFPRIIPLRPMWSELILNVAAYGSAAALLGVPFTAIRRTRRLRRGQCTVCGYERRGLSPEAACPECGQPPQPFDKR
jgi:hypothetical protein